LAPLAFAARAASGKTRNYMHFRLKNNRLNCIRTLDIAQKSGVKRPAGRAKNAFLKDF
jgi:hypothetical protein